jgi:hypothetical protein
MSAAIQLLYSIPELINFLSSFDLNELNIDLLNERQKEFKNRLHALKLIFNELTKNGSDPKRTPIDLIKMPLTLIDGTTTNIYEYFVKPKYVTNSKGKPDIVIDNLIKYADMNEGYHA